MTIDEKLWATCHAEMAKLGMVIVERRQLSALIYAANVALDRKALNPTAAASASNAILVLSATPSTTPPPPTPATQSD